jgi:hypothetical protein
MKGLVGGIPIALLAAAAQAMEHGTVSLSRTGWRRARVLTTSIAERSGYADSQPLPTRRWHCHGRTVWQ